MVGSTLTRRVFRHPEDVFVSDQSGDYLNTGGTTDMQFCKQVVEDRIFEKAGWPQYQKMAHPFLIDTSIFVKHIDNDGVQWPLRIPDELLPSNGNGKKK